MDPRNGTPTASCSTDRRRGGAVTIEMLFLLLPMLTFVVLAISVATVRLEHQRSKIEAHQDLFADLTGGTTREIGDLTFAAGPRPARFELRRAAPYGLALDPLPNETEHALGERTFGVSFTPDGREHGAYRFREVTFGLRPPWAWTAAPVVYQQNWLETSRVHAWYERGHRKVIGPFERRLRLARGLASPH